MLAGSKKKYNKKNILRVLIQKFMQAVMVKQWYYQNVPYVAVKSQNLLKKQEAKGLLSSLGIRTPLSKIPLLGDVLF